MSAQRQQGIFQGLAFLVFMIFIAQHCLADLHVQKEEKRYSKDLSRNSTSTADVWRSKSAEYYAARDQITITRQDLKKRWVINAKAKTYLEISLDHPPSPEAREKLHNEGYEYEPELDWVLKETREEKEICGFGCKKFVLEGDADYSKKTIEIWITDAVGIHQDSYDHPERDFQGREAGPLLEKYEPLKNRFVLWEKVIDERPIGQTYIWESRVLKIEEAQAPAGIYDLPQGLKKEELTDEFKRRLWP
jgi:hypothetical protein